MNPFGVANYALRQIESTSQRIADSTENVHDVELFRLGLRMIAMASRALLQALDQVSASSSSDILDERLSVWLSSPQPMECLVVLQMMGDNIIGSSPPADNKVREAVNLFQEKRHQFDFLLTVNIWNPEPLIQRSPGVHSSKAGAHPQKTSSSISEVSAMARTVHENDLPDAVREMTLDAGTSPVVKQDLQKLQDVLTWLNGLRCNRKHKYTYSLRHPDTCEWFRHTSAYQEWRSGSQPFLWSWGKAGAGKSVLAASTIEHLRNSLEEREILIFFYCDFADKRATNAAEIMRSLLSQLLCQFRDRGVVPGDLLKTILEEKCSGDLSLTDITSLCGFVSRAANCCTLTPLIIIDALDECTDLESLLECLVTLVKDGIRLLVTSRPLQVIKDFFENLPCPSLSLENMANALASDIAVYVTKSIESSRLLGRLDVAVKKEICAVLNRKADGMFKWVQCQIDVLAQCRTMGDVWKTLNSLPSGLEETYERILRAINERPLGATLARRALVWLVLSLEPLQFCQLDEALSVDLEQRNITDEARPMNRQAFLDALSSLVLYNEQTDAVTLSHFSVKEYLMRAAAQSRLPYHVKQQDGHAWIARFCMCYISLYLSKPQRGKPAQSALEAWPMLGYVFSSGFDHLAHINGGSIPLLNALTSLQSDILRHPVEWDQLCELREERLRWPYRGPAWPSSGHDLVFYILIAYASKTLLQTVLPFLIKQLRSKPRNGTVTNPLVYATELQKTEHAVTLLSHLGSAYVDIRGLTLDDSEEVLPLEIAVERNNYELVDKFLSLGSPVPVLLLERAICMPWCTTRILARLLQTHQFMEWAASNTTDDEPYRGMFSSGRPGTGEMATLQEDHIAIARRLLQIGCGISVNSSLGMKLVKQATYAGHLLVLEHLLSPDVQPPSYLFLDAAISDVVQKISVLRFLINRRVDVRTVSPSGDTALHFVMSSLSEERALEATKMLVEAGCDPWACNERHETPLHKAVKHGHISVVKHLLSLDNAPNPLPFDVLHAGLESASTERMIRFLIDKGVDVRSVTSRGDTALHLAMGSYSERDCLATVKILVEAQCNPRARNQRGHTLIHAAIRAGYVSVMEYLLALDVPLPPNVLRFAIRQPSSLQMIRLLVAGGANVPLDDDYGAPLFRLVVWSESYTEEERLEIIKILARAGASLGDPEALMHTAAEFGYTSVLGYLLEHGVPLPPAILLHALRMRSSPQMIRFLVEKGANLQATTAASGAQTVLHLAIESAEEEENSLEIVKLLVNAGASLGDGAVLIEDAVCSGHTSTIAYLLSQNIHLPPNILPLALQRRANVQTIRLLAQNGADLRALTLDDGMILANLPMGYKERECLEVIKALVNLGASHGDGATLIKNAVCSGHTSVITYLLSQNIHLPSDILPFALQHKANVDTICLLVQNGADFQIGTNNERTLYRLTMQYTEEECLEVIKALVDLGASHGDRATLIKNAVRYGHTSVITYLLSQNTRLPFDILPFALQHKANVQTIRLLAQNGADRQALTAGDEATLPNLPVGQMQDEEEECLEVIKALVNLGATLGESATPVKNAARSDCTSLLACLLSQNIHLPPNVIFFANVSGLHRLTNNAEKTLYSLAMHYTKEECLEIVKILLTAGESLSSGATLVKNAIRSGFSSFLTHKPRLPPDIQRPAVSERERANALTIRLLAYYGMDLRALTLDDGTILVDLPLGYRERECLEIVRVLLYGGASLANGAKLLKNAIQSSYTSLIAYLLSHDVPLPYDILPFALQQHSSALIIQLLVNRGADVHAVPSHGDTPLHLAAMHYEEREYLEVVKILISAGCDTRRLNASGASFIRSAMMNRARHHHRLVLDYVSSLRLPLPSDIPPGLEPFSSKQTVCSLPPDRGTDVNGVSAHGGINPSQSSLLVDQGLSTRRKRGALADAEDNLDTRPSKEPRLQSVPEDPQ